MGKQRNDGVPRTERLTPQQSIFCVEYVKDSNGKRAAIAAGYSEDCAEVTASKLLRQAKVQREVQRLVEACTARALITADRVVQELGRIALADPLAAFDDEGNLKPMKDIPEDLRRAIAGVEVDELWEGRGNDREQVGVTRKVKFWSKTSALETLAGILKMLHKHVEVTGKNGEPLVPAAKPIDLSKFTKAQLLALAEATKA